MYYAIMYHNNNLHIVYNVHCYSSLSVVGVPEATCNDCCDWLVSVYTYEMAPGG